jgi:hypothetical protein
MMKNDPWLEKWLRLIRGSLQDLSLGLGYGMRLIRPICWQQDAMSLQPIFRGRTWRRGLPWSKMLLQMDIENPALCGPQHTGIMASLSLHYFSWEVTLQISSELKRCIKGGGLLLARCNSTNDLHHGASSPSEIEPNFYQVETRTKRIFDESGVHLFLQEWEVQFLEENLIHRYQKPKWVWEAVAVCK